MLQVCTVPSVAPDTQLLSVSSIQVVSQDFAQITSERIVPEGICDLVAILHIRKLSFIEVYIRHDSSHVTSPGYEYRFMSTLNT